MRSGIVYKLIVLLLIAAITAIYLFIPASIRVSKGIKVNAFNKTLFFLLNNSASWQQWDQQDPASNGYSFTILKSNYPVIFIEAGNGKNKIPVEIELISNKRNDSCYLYWHCEFPGGYTPWSRMQGYIEARKFKEIFSKKMEMLIGYAGKTENIYGIPIVESKVKDTLVATLSRYELSPPEDSLICKMISSLRQQISDNNLLITDSAMALMPYNQEGKYKVMVGFPVNKMPNKNSAMLIKKMVPGKLLTGTIHGGPASISKGYEQMKKYIADHGMEEAALPYVVWATNRCVEKDTGKLVTKICYPVF